MAGMTDRLSDERLRELCDPVPKAMPASEVPAMARELIALRKEVAELRASRAPEGLREGMLAILRLMSPNRQSEEWVADHILAMIQATGPVMPYTPSEAVRAVMAKAEFWSWINGESRRRQVWEAARAALIAEQKERDQ